MQLQEEAKEVETELAKHPRGYLVLYNLIILTVLFLTAAYYSSNKSDLFDSFFNLQKPLSWGVWKEEILISIWFAILGAVAMNFKGINHYLKETNKKFNTWDLWYLDRPLSGVIAGIMTYFLLQVANLSSPPSLISLSIIAFIFGMQEHKFSSFVNKISELILNNQQNKK